MGLIANLTWLGVVVENGYVEPYSAVGGPEIGNWTVYIAYYASLEKKQESIDNKLPVLDQTLNQMIVPYVSGTDPFSQAMTVLQAWFPDGEVA